MSRHSASDEHASNSTGGGSYAQEDDSTSDVAHARNGSVLSKLVAKNNVQVATRDEVNGYPNGEQDAPNSRVNGDTEHDDAVESHDHDRLEWEDDDRDEDEFVPPDSNDESGESDEESDLDDEETSMRSLLLPMATYAKQLLFLSDEDDDGEFDAQDAELWSSPEEKRAWIDRYEATNRSYIDQYGCRIDAPAIPEIKKRLRRERHREAKYSLVLLVLALAYFIRLMMGPTSVTISDITTSSAVPSPIGVLDDTNSAPQPSVAHPARSEWTTTNPPWWTTWTEEFVVRMFSWPRAAIVHFQTPSTASSQLEIVNDSTLRDESRQEQIPREEVPPTALIREQESPREQEVNERSEVSSPSEKIEVVTSIESVVTTAVESVVVPDPQHPMGKSRNDGPVETSYVSESIVSVGESTTVVADNGDVISTTRTEVVIEAEVVVVEDRTVVETTADYESAKSHADENASQDTLVKDAGDPTSNRDENEIASSVQQCSEMLQLVVKTKNDQQVKADATSACDRAVLNTPASPAARLEWIEAHVLRGDLRSLLFSFLEAQSDYVVALERCVGVPKVAKEITLKMLANRWIELYQAKEYKQLRKECTEAFDATVDTPDRSHELARDWLQAFRKEKTLLEVLTKTRAWTIYRVQMPSREE